MNDPLVIFSPLPPAKSGIADYTAELLPALSDLREIVVVCERKPVGTALNNGVIIDVDEYARDPSWARCPHIYQIGNNADHVFAYRAIQAHPGILVQHDFNLHYLVEDATLVLGDPAGYRQVLLEEYGEPGARLADLRHAGLFSEAQKLALPLNTHLLRLATGIIVHSQWVHDRLPKDVRDRAVVVPHHYAPQAAAFDSLTKQQAREQLKLDDSFVVLALGYVTPPKQIQATLAALSLLRRRGARFLFVIGGERNPGFDIDDIILRHELTDCVRVTGYLGEDEFFRYIAAADVLVNLRHPSVGESSGTLSRALALGLPAIVYNFGPFAEMPDEAVLKVPLELGRPVALAAALETLMLDPLRRVHMGKAARRHMRNHCSVRKSAARYVELVDTLYPPSASPVRSARAGEAGSNAHQASDC